MYLDKGLLQKLSEVEKDLKKELAQCRICETLPKTITGHNYLMRLKTMLNKDAGDFFFRHTSLIDVAGLKQIVMSMLKEKGINFNTAIVEFSKEPVALNVHILFKNFTYKSIALV